MNEKIFDYEIALMKAERVRVFNFVDHVLSTYMYSQATVDVDVDSELFSDSCKYVELITQLRTLREYLKTSAVMSDLSVSLMKKQEDEM